MLKRRKIAIVLADTLHRIGLNSLLNEYFAHVNVVCFTSFTELMVQNENFDYYFTDTVNYVTGLDYFLLRKNKTCILVDTEIVQDNSNRILPVLASVETLIESLESLLENQTSSSYNKENDKNLSSREIEVLKQVVKGETNKEIADMLSISLNTVLSHRKNIIAKLGIKTVPGLTIYAIMNGIITSEEF